MREAEQKSVRWLFVIFALKQLVWTAFIPPWQFPDEQAHFAQVQNVAERRSISAFPGPNTSREIVESEVLLGTIRDGFGNNKFTYHPDYKLPLDASAIDIEEKIKQLPRLYHREMVTYEATVYPPLYYLFAAPLYRRVYQADLLTRIFIVRLINIPIFLLTLCFVYLIGKLLFGKLQLLTVLLVMFVGFHPMFSFVSAGTTSDNLYHLLSTSVIYLSLRLIQKGINTTWLVATLGVSLLLWWTKPQGKLMYLVIAGSIFFSMLRNNQRSPKRSLLLMLLVLMMGTFGYMLLQLAAGAQFLPEIPGWDVVREGNLTLVSHLKWTLNHTYREVLPWYWGVFRWLSLTYPRPVHRIINWSMLFSFIGLALFLLRKRKMLPVSRSSAWFLLVANLIYFLGLFAFDYLFTRTHQFSFGIQGRYYFPLLVTQMALIMMGLACLFNLFRIKQALFALTGITMLALHLYAQLLVIFSYLSPTSISSFFTQASFYKPYFFKSPVLEVLIGVYTASLVIFLWYYVRAIWDGESQYERIDS